MIVGEMPVARMAGDPQRARHRALSRGQDGADQQHLGMQPRALDEERREGDDQRGEAGGQVRHGDFSWRNVASLAHPLASSTRSDQTAQLAKVELRRRARRLGRSLQLQSAGNNLPS